MLHNIGRSSRAQPVAPCYILASPIVGLQSPLATAEPIPGFGQPPISPNKTCQRTLFSAKHNQRAEVAQLASAPLPASAASTVPRASSGRAA